MVIRGIAPAPGRRVAKPAGLNRALPGVIHAFIATARARGRGRLPRRGQRRCRRSCRHDSSACGVDHVAYPRARAMTRPRRRLRERFASPARTRRDGVSARKTRTQIQDSLSLGARPPLWPLSQVVRWINPSASGDRFCTFSSGQDPTEEFIMKQLLATDRVSDTMKARACAWWGFFFGFFLYMAAGDLFR